MPTTDPDDLFAGTSADSLLAAYSTQDSAASIREDQEIHDLPDVLPDADPALSGEDNLAREVTAADAAFRARQAREDERLRLATLADFWLCLTFATTDIKDRFLQETGWGVLGSRYIRGREVAALLDITLPDDPEWPRESKPSPDYLDLALTREEVESYPPTSPLGRPAPDMVPMLREREGPRLAAVRVRNLARAAAANGDMLDPDDVLAALDPPREEDE